MQRSRFGRFQANGFAIVSSIMVCVTAASGQEFRSHPPSRPLPTALKAELAQGPRRFVDATKGNDTQDGSQLRPWRTIRHAERQLTPGDTLYLRGGTYYETVSLSRSGTQQHPITIASYPGELAVIDGGQREFFESPQSSWIPHEAGGPGEFISTQNYLWADDRKVPHQFLPASWEPMWGIEEERPIVLGHFGDSLVPLHGYRTVEDLRSSNEFWIGNKEQVRASGIYCGPGLWFNRSTGRIHVRLAHHRLEGLGPNSYRGETDPRKIPLVISVGFGEDVLRLSGVKHVRLERLVLRGATGSPMIHVYGSEHIELDHVSVFGGFPGLMVSASKNVRVQHSVFRGLAAPWTSRAHMKYRGTASYQVILQNAQPSNENIELAHCEFTDDHDFAFLRFVKNLQFHHNFVDNFNDDGLECGPKLRSHSLFIYQNRIGRCLIPLTQHEMDRDESPAEHDQEAGVFVLRNVFDMRGGTYKAPPEKPDPSGSFLREEGHLIGDHGSPVWPVLKVYHNTFLRHTPVFRNSYLFGLGSQGLRLTERDVMNNIFFETNSRPGVGFIGLASAEPVREGGNLLWGGSSSGVSEDSFAKFRSSNLFRDSMRFYPPGWTTHDRFADPAFVTLLADDTQPTDLRLRSNSPAINRGLSIPDKWPDPIRDLDKDVPDIGAIPFGADVWRVGVDGRIPGA